MSKYRNLFILFMFLTTSIFAQVNFEPIDGSVYNFLERMSNKGIIQLNEEIKPFSRIYIAEKILNLEIRIQNSKGKTEKIKISELEKEELIFYIREFSSELNRLGFDINMYKAKEKLVDFTSDKFGFDKYNRFRLFSYDTDRFGLFVDPVFRFNFTFGNENNSTLWSNGLRVYGSIANNIGFSLKFYDNHFSGNLDNFDRAFSPLTGYEWNSSRGQGIDFDRMNANLTFSWYWGNFSIGKDVNYYGSGEDGKILLSGKAPSFPQIKLEINPVEWLRFSYIHGLLNSQVLDSTTFRFNPYRNHISTVEKYLVTHMLSITPIKYLNISLGESVIYSDKFEPIYLIPIAFFRLSDHYLSDPDENAGNAQLFASIWYKNYWLQTKFYSSIFIDELSLNNSAYPQAIAYNVGLKSIDPIIPESELVFEYTRINPFVYFHADSAQTYASYGYELGHWIGSNADEIYASFTKRIIRGLNVDFWYRYIRKGDEEDFEEERYQKEQTFLWGNTNFITMYGTSLKYEVIHNFNINFTYEYSKTNGGNDYLLNPGSIFRLAMNYGL